MFVIKIPHISRAHISKNKRRFNVKSSTYYFHMKTKMLADFQICISTSLEDPELIELTNQMHKSLSLNMYTVIDLRKVFYTVDHLHTLHSFRGNNPKNI